MLALLVAIPPLIAWWMSGDLDPLELWLGSDRLTIRSRRHMMGVSLAGAAARRLEADEIDHLRGLTTFAGFMSSGATLDSHLVGELALYASDLDNAVLLDLGEDRMVVTPDDPEGFLAAVEAAGARRAVG